MRILFFIGVLISGLVLPWYVFLVIALGYALYFPSYELIILGMMIDAQFGIGVSQFGYVYTASLSALVFLVECIKPYLRMYDV